MILPRTLFQAALQKALSWSASLHAQGTGGLYQKWLLQAMGVKVEGLVAIASGTTFLGPRNLRLGRYVTIGADSRIVSWAPVTIGDDFMASDRLTLNSGGHDPVTLAPQLKGIAIGNRVWCGAGVTICAGVEIGDDVVIGAGSMVTRSISSNSVAYGTPARVVRSLDRAPGTPLWSLWPERNRSGEFRGQSRWRGWAHWLWARL